MTPDDIRALVRRQPFLPLKVNLADGRSFDIHHPDYLIVPPERSSSVFVFHKGGTWDVIYIRQITSITTEGDVPPMTSRSNESDAA